MSHSTHFVKRVNTSLLDVDAAIHCQQEATNNIEFSDFVGTKVTAVSDGMGVFDTEYSETEVAIREYVAKSVKIGKSYFVSIDPGYKMSIDRYEHQYAMFVQRYIVFFDIGNNCRLAQPSSEIVPHALIKFDMDTDHLFENGSDISWIFFVFDVYKDTLDQAMSMPTNHVEMRRKQDLEDQQETEARIKNNVEPLE